MMINANSDDYDISELFCNRNKDYKIAAKCIFYTEKITPKV